MPQLTAPWSLGAFVTFATVSPLLASQPTSLGDPMLVVGWPWAGPDAALQAVLAEDGAQVVRADAGGWIVVARAGRRSGAWPGTFRVPIGRGLGCAGGVGS